MKKKVLFACDLDNTLLVSYRCRQDGDICVETIQDKKQSFMTVRAIELLRQVIRKVDFVPVTTRSLEQYRRIRWPEGCEPELAVTTNGAALMREGSVDVEWGNQVRETVVEVWSDDINSLYEKHSLSKNLRHCRIVDDSYLFLCCDNGTEAAAYADICRRQSRLEVENVGRKIYMFPPGLKKGAALVRLKKILGSNYACAAGDSSVDISMLEQADMGFAENSLKGKVGANCLLQPQGSMFSEWFLCELLKLLREE